MYNFVYQWSNYIVLHSQHGFWCIFQICYRKQNSEQFFPFTKISDFLNFRDIRKKTVATTQWYFVYTCATIQALVWVVGIKTWFLLFKRVFLVDLKNKLTITICGEINIINNTYFNR